MREPPNGCFTNAVWRWLNHYLPFQRHSNSNYRSERAVGQSSIAHKESIENIRSPAMHAAMRHKGVVPIHISAARLPLCLNAPQPARAMRARTSVPSQTRLPVAHATDARVRYNAKLQRDSVGPSNDVPVTLTVNISQRAQSGGVRLSQEDCTELLRALGILATVYPTMSSVGDLSSSRHYLENGLSLILQKIQKTTVRETLWPLIRERYGLTCAHVSENDFKGCILDWMRPSLCPGKTGCQVR